MLHIRWAMTLNCIANWYYLVLSAVNAHRLHGQWIIDPDVGNWTMPNFWV